MLVQGVGDKHSRARKTRVKHKRPSFVATIASKQHFWREAMFPWTETLVYAAFETAI
jgi:hypothetical protein